MIRNQILIYANDVDLYTPPRQVKAWADGLNDMILPGARANENDTDISINIYKSILCVS